MKTLSRSVIHTLQGRCIDEQIFVLHTHHIHTQTSAVMCPKSTPCPLILCCLCLVNPLEVSLTKGFPSAFCTLTALFVTLTQMHISTVNLCSNISVCDCLQHKNICKYNIGLVMCAFIFIIKRYAHFAQPGDAKLRKW